MKIVQFASFGTPHEVVECVEVPDVGAPAADEVVVEVEAFPINPVDLLSVHGHYAVKPPLPATLGARAAAVRFWSHQMTPSLPLPHPGEGNRAQQGVAG